MSERIPIDQYYRIRDGRIQRVREHMRKRHRWTVKAFGPSRPWDRR